MLIFEMSFFEYFIILFLLGVPLWIIAAWFISLFRKKK